MIFAVPIAAAAKTLIEELCLEDYLGGPWEVRGSHGRSQFPRWLNTSLAASDD